jgi:AcrR family transcriptional regulator
MSTPSQVASPEIEARAPKRQRGRERVAVLVDAAASVFVEKGYDAATMTEIAARANSSIGSLYQFFPTKPLLAEALHVERLAALTTMLDDLAVEVAGKPPAEIGEAIFDRFGAFLHAFPEFAILAARRDIPKDRKARSRAALLANISAMLASANPPVAHARGEVLAGVILEFIRIIVVAGEDSNVELRAAIIAELRQMLIEHLQMAANRA